MKLPSASVSRAAEIRRWPGRLAPAGRALRDWAGSDALVWVHLAKTVGAALLAMGIAMRLELSQPRIAMTTVFVLMQPMSGMVFAKSFYRVIGTAVGLVAALALGGLFAQQPALYMAGITLWIGACIAAAVRNRHFRWYGYVLAGYTAALIGIPAVETPNALFISALTRAAEVGVGIVCSAAVSALVLPLSSSRTLMRSLQARHLRFCAFAVAALDGRLARGEFERRFADFIDDIVGFDAIRAYASFEDPRIRARSRRLARLNDEFVSASTRLHALRQLHKRLVHRRAAAVLAALAPLFGSLAATLGRLHDGTDQDAATPSTRRHAGGPADALAGLQALLAALPAAALAARRPIEAEAPGDLLDFDTAIELLTRFVAEFAGYARTHASLAHDTGALDKVAPRYEVRTNGVFVAFTFVRSLVVIGAVGAFWLATAWPSGGLATIAAAIACALSSTSPRAPRFVAQMGAGAALATLAGYLYLCFVYPAIDGFTLLCAALAPLLAAGVFMTTRPRLSGYGVGFIVFFCLLAGPDNWIVYAPDLLLNNGLAVVAAMLAAALVFAVIFPTEMPWLSERIQRDLRGRIRVACEAPLDGLHARFQSSAHELTSHLRQLLLKRSARHRIALRWLLVTLEIGHAVIDLRVDLQPFTRSRAAGEARWLVPLRRVLRLLPELFEAPDPVDPARLLRTQRSVELAIRAIQRARPAWEAAPEPRRQMRRVLAGLHFVRSALLDRDAPFVRTRRRRRGG
ncbi:FUSC family protein [Burkholderia plantarii]|uniref:Fusaric acid resistance protein FusC n=1 Tax=Burkholderia plantarii TaxID=41899 RepID=A0A0B6S4G4_BURPL|nr:FUSC family protein [Burkholderia plantarii]AJK49279.1 fusaric acid resistance protein FusC [Burkholderia plantarii]